MNENRTNQRVQSSISPQTWGLPPAGNQNSPRLAEMGLPKEELESRARHNTYEWLKKQFNEEVGAFYGYYDARTHSLTAPQTVNLIAPFQLLAAFDRFGDEELLVIARRSADWLETNMVETHPMSVVLGGVRDNIKHAQLWTKYTADYVVLNLGLWDRLHDERYLDRAIQGSRFLLQSQNHGFAPKYDDWQERWILTGWQSFGRVICAMIALHEFTGDEQWLDRCRVWGEYGLKLQAENGCFYLINDTYYSSDIAADEIRAFVRLFWRCRDPRYLEATMRFAGWHVRNQTQDGAWCLSEDRWGVPVGSYVGPGDAPNIAVALLLVHKATGDPVYVASAARALRYSLSQQQVPGRSTGHYLEDSMTYWGYWSWDPPYDFTMSADQSTHHVRGYWFFLDYFLSLDEAMQGRIAASCVPGDPAS